MTAALPPDVRHRNLVRLVVEIVRGVVGNGMRLMLGIEDAQWMDLQSMKLLLKARALARVELGVGVPVPCNSAFLASSNVFYAFRTISCFSPGSHLFVACFWAVSCLL